MKETDQLSLGSVISLRSVSDGAALETGRTTEENRKKTTGSPYGAPTKSSSKTKKTGREVWVTAVKNGTGISAESSGMNTWNYGKPNNLKNRSSASKFLMEQLNMPVSGKSTRPSSARAGGSGPVYKDPESYYDEIQTLKRMLKQSKTELDLLKAKNNRLEDELVAKSRKIDELLNPDTQNNDLRRTLGSKKPDASEVVMSLRRKIYKLEETLRSKENELRKINSELKVTNIEELKFENETYLYEIQRLNQILQENQAGTMNKVSESEINDALRDGKGKKAQILIKRLTEDNHSLVLENKSLKNDLMKLTQPVVPDAVNLEKDYEDMNRSELLQKILTLEQKVKEEESQTVKSEKLEEKSGDVDAEQIDDRCIQLKGPLPQQLKQLRARERELLGDVERLENTVKKLKEDRSHYRKMNDDYRQQLDQLSSGKNNTDNISDTASVKSDSVKTRRKSSGLTPRRSTEKKASKKVSAEEREEKVKALQETRAAKTIQRGWRNRPGKNEVYKDEEDELEDAIVSIQSAWRGHQRRSAYLEQTMSEQDTRLGDDDVLLIQAAFRGHASRKNMLSKQKSRYQSPSRASSRDIEADQRPSYDIRQYISDDDNEDDDVVIGSSASLSKYRDGKKPIRRQPRNPTYFTDPDARPHTSSRENRHYSSSRGNGISDFLDEDDERDKGYRELSQRFQQHDSSSKVTINKLKSASSPWDRAKIIEEESDEDILSRSKSSKSLQKQFADNDSADLHNKWAKSGSQRKVKQSEERFERKRSLRKSHELLRDFRKDEQASNSQSIKKRMDSIVSRKHDLDDELF